MALKINATPVLNGKAAKYFLESVEKEKTNKVTKEEAEKIKKFSQEIIAKSKL